MKDYRKQFEKHYGIKVSAYYDIHHIDQNHQNNDINNLMILPKELHFKYHYLLMEYSKIGKIDFRITGNMLSRGVYFLDIVEEMIKTIRECNKWFDYKLYLEGKLPNIHNITLEV